MPVSVRPECSAKVHSNTLLGVSQAAGFFWFQTTVSVIIFESTELRECLSFGEPHVNESLTNRLDKAEVKNSIVKTCVFTGRLLLQAQEETAAVRV